MYQHTILLVPQALEINSHQRVQWVDSVGNVPERLFANGLYFTEARLRIATYHSPRFEVSASRDIQVYLLKGPILMHKGGLPHLPDNATSLHCVLAPSRLHNKTYTYRRIHHIHPPSGIRHPQSLERDLN